MRFPWLALIACLAGPARAPAQAAAVDLTVRLFDTDRVRAVELTPSGRGATWTRCPRCASEPFTQPFAVAFEPGKRDPVEVRGQLRIEAEGGRRALAAGIWRIDGERDGLRVRLTLPSERYVAAVLSAEAAPDEPAASLRALAIVVRSFALNRASRHEELCDSTRCQAMRLGAVSPAIEAAVRDTAGETLWFGGVRVPAFFTQSSGGASEDAAAAWGGARRPWLPAHRDPPSERTPSQWHATIGPDELRAALAAQGYPLPAPLRAVGILRRTSSGRAATIAVSAGTERLELPAASFRFAVNRSLGWDRLRSDLYTVQMGAGGRAEFDGRGFGHGVGLSQSGARQMAAEGRDERTILRFYFPGAEVRIEAGDDGWRARAGAWGTFVSTGETQDALLREADEAWRRAHALLGRQIDSSQAAHLTVRVFPTTALFSGVTGEPGWTLGVTRGEEIALQSPQVVARSNPRAGAFGDLLLHEMLHAGLERETVAAVPLWFREGLVEALTGQRAARGPGSALHVAAVEAHLEHPATLAEADRAHREAGLLVERLIAAYGADTVRGWLRRGLPMEAVRRAGLP